jgi:hypothetical protein
MRGSFFLFLLLTAIAFIPLAGRTQNVQKTVMFTVTDATTGKPVEGAEVRFKTLIGKLIKKTGSDGKVSFNLYLVGSQGSDWSYTISDLSKAHKTYTGTLTLLASKDYYEVAPLLQATARKVSVSISDANRQPLANTEVRLKDVATPFEVVTITDGAGIASFDMPPGASSGNLILKINKQGFTALLLPVAIDDQASRVEVLVPVQQNIVQADMEVMKPADMLGPTQGLEPTNTLTNPVFFPIPDWGPYQPQCEANVFDDIPFFSHIYVEQEKSFLETITSSCLEPATKALDSVIMFLDAFSKLQPKFQSLYEQAVRENNLDPGFVAATGMWEQKDPRLREEFNNTRRQILGMVNKMQEFAKGPMAYLASCVWDGIKDYALPDDVNKILKTPEDFEKATKSAEAITKELTETKYLPLQVLKNYLLDEFTNIGRNLEKTVKGMNLAMTYLADPTKLLPYKMQTSMALRAAESGMNTIMTDCQIRECDRQIKRGIMAGKEALTASRKLIAQKARCMSDYNEMIVNDIGRKVQPSPQAYLELDNCRKQLLYAQADSAEIRSQLERLAKLCEKIQPIAAVLNARVNKYEQLYNSGVTALEKCKMGEAQLYVNQLLALENSECGHFYPKPYGIAKSEDLKNKIAKVKESGFCNKEKEVITKKGEQKYGPFLVSSGAWLPTGITLKKGDYIRVQADSFFVTKIKTHVGPEGGGHWMWWTLAGEIGTQRFYLSRDLGGEITEGGELKLGTPRGLGSKEFIKEDVDNLSGSLKVMVFVKRK